MWWEGLHGGRLRVDGEVEVARERGARGCGGCCGSSRGGCGRGAVQARHDVVQVQETESASPLWLLLLLLLLLLSLLLLLLMVKKGRWKGCWHGRVLECAGSDVCDDGACGSEAAEACGVEQIADCGEDRFWEELE